MEKYNFDIEAYECPFCRDGAIITSFNDEVVPKYKRYKFNCPRHNVFKNDMCDSAHSAIVAWNKSVENLIHMNGVIADYMRLCKPNDFSMLQYDSVLDLYPYHSNWTMIMKVVDKIEHTPFGRNSLESCTNVKILSDEILIDSYKYDEYKYDNDFYIKEKIQCEVPDSLAAKNFALFTACYRYIDIYNKQLYNKSEVKLC
jgi:hypothetical protein